MKIRVVEFQTEGVSLAALLISVISSVDSYVHCRIHNDSNAL